MNKKVINKDQFRKLVIEEAKKIMSEDKEIIKESTDDKFSFNKVENLIKEMEGINKSISSIDMIDPTDKEISKEVIKEEEYKNPIKKDSNMKEYNNGKNVLHTNEGEKEKWNRMLKYEIPKDNER